ncbi:DUF6207 family protein [Streptomyces sp. NPDC092903]|uniref:DUF6207 family protein n=1 Tax=Streptomyces sp. NPDC092903 TaxID=3366017 RepID=UPI0037FE6FA6
MGDIATAHLSGPGTAYVDIVGVDEATVRQIVALLSGTWTTSGSPTVQSAGHVPGQATCSGRLFLDTTLPAPGKKRVLPVDWVRFTSPPWGARTDGVKESCLRCRRDGQACGRQAAEWPRGYGAEDPGACWSHLTKDEQQDCVQVRQTYRGAFRAMKLRHQEEAGHGRNEWCDGCTLLPWQTSSGAAF